MNNHQHFPKGKPHRLNETFDKNASSAFKAPAIELPKGGGAIRSIDEKFSVNASNGTASFALPVPVSDARGFSPSLSLSYSSGGGNGIFGLGWGMSVGSIKRKTDKELPRYQDATDSDTYLLSQAEDLVPVVSLVAGRWKNTEQDSADGNYVIRLYRPRIEAGFARIERWTNKLDGGIHWRVISNTNSTSIYGQQASSRLADPSDERKVFEWFLEFSYDDKGHAILYEYVNENSAGLPTHHLHERNRANGLAPYANVYLKRVRYGNVEPYVKHGDPFPTKFLFENVLDYGEHDFTTPPFNATGFWNYRSDAFSDYRSGFEIRTARLCRRIILYHHFAEYSAPVKTITFTYGDNGQQGFRFLNEAVITGYTQHDDGSYTHQSLPPFSFTYQQHEWNITLKTIGADALEHAPSGINEPQYQWIDLFGEGLSGLLTEQGNSWYYKHNLGGGNFTPARKIDPKPSFSGFGSQAQLLELEGDTLKQLVHNEVPRGFFNLNEEKDWEPFIAFEEYPNLNLKDPNSKMLDLDGDGRPDILIAEEEVFTWYPSAGKKGYAAAQQVRRATDEEKGPHMVFADGTETIFISGMSGSGLSDIVRIRNGEVCYWPNLGYGRFGAKVNMSNAPHFDHPDNFNPAFIRLGDIDGSGTTDIIYLGKARCSIWMNLQGNSFTPAPVEIPTLPEISTAAKISLLDLLGTGTSCIVWNSAHPKYGREPLRYIDLMQSRKPHVMTAYKNNIGKEILLEYSPSTQFYVEDKLAGRPWVTRLPFPVQCVSKVVSIDRILKLRFASTYSYHHGYYDVDEREFRGFGRAEQVDAEFIDHFVKESAGMMNNVVEHDLHQHPVKTISWFHTGAWKGREKVLNQFAHEYYQNPFVAEHRLPEPELDSSLSAQECREAVRTCKGTLLRKEVYALDSTTDEDKPYETEQHNVLIRRLQPVAINKFAVFYSHESESITYHYERNPADPRVSHSLVLEIDEQWGLVKKSASVGYPRRPPLGGMPPHPAEQTQLLISYAEQWLTNEIVTSDTHRAPIVYASRAFEVVGLPPGPTGYFERNALLTSCSIAVTVDYHETPVAGQKRLVGLSRSQFRHDDTVTPLAFGVQGSKGLPHKSFQAVLNRPMLQLFNAHITSANLEAMLTDPAKGGYVFADNYFWIPSGTVNYDKDHFYRTTIYTDAFGKVSTIAYDAAYGIFIRESEDALHNKTSILKFNWRVLSPALVEDPNRNQAAVRFDEMGMVVKGFVLGKPGVDKGDVFDDTRAEGSGLDQPTVEISYFLHEWFNQSTAPGFDVNAWYKPKPNYVYTRARETHYMASPTHLTNWQESYSYSDGNGHEILKKIQAENGEARQVNADGTVTTIPNADPRWVGNGRIVLNNKGNTVKAYEPYFCVNAGFDDEREMVEIGFSSISRYDAMNRIIRVDNPNGTYTKVEFTPWIELDYDQNDTVRNSDCRWYSDRASPDPGDPEPGNPEQRAAWLSASHFNTPTVNHADSLGRTWLVIADNGSLGKYHNRVVYDIEGNERSVHDALGRTVAEYDNDMVGGKIRQKSMDSGTRWKLNDVMGKPLVTWDERGYMFTYDYDDAHRPIASYVTEAGLKRMIDRTEYGETAPSAADPVGNKLMGNIYKHYDQSGIATHLAYDFKGKLLKETHQFTSTYDELLDWSTIASVALSPELFESSTAYDAMNRPLKITSPHSAGIPASEISPKYNKANLIDSIDVSLRGEPVVQFIENINYNAKGYRTEVYFGNGTKSKYSYDEVTHRLTDILTTKNTGAVKLQDIHYTYDAVGNITEVVNTAQPVKFFSGEEVKPVNKYIYDAVYRLISASGRKHAGQNVIEHNSADFNYSNHPFIPNLTSPPAANDANAFCNYKEEYQYDAAGNLLEQKQTSSFNAFTRTFEYDFGMNANNHLTKTTVGAFSTTYGAYDAHGNMPKMEHLSALTWNHRDQLSMVDLGGGGKAWYTYDSGGKRMRKVIKRLDGSRRERLYVGIFELYREYDAAGTEQLRRESLNIMSGDHRIALVETKTKDAGVIISSPLPLQRYQYDNNLGSVTMELDDVAQVISYEEYFPFGSTSFRTIDGTREVPKKRYRYTGKERDDESGFNYHNARYYAPWLCRWTAADPLHTADGNNMYIYCHNSPIAHHDPTGTLTWGQWAGIGAAVVIGTVVTVATAGAAGPIVGTVAAGIIGGIVGGAAGGAVAEAVEARIDNREAHIGRAALTGAIVGGAFAGAGAAVGAIARSAAGQAAGAAISRSVVGAAGRAVGSAVSSAARSVGQSAVGQAVRSGASRVASSVVGRGAATIGRGISAGLQGLESGAARVGQRVVAATTRSARAAYGSISTSGYPGRTFFQPGRRVTEREAEQLVARSPFRARRSDIRSFERAVQDLGAGHEIQYVAEAQLAREGHSIGAVIRSDVKSGFNGVDAVTIVNPRAAPVQVGALTDEYLHMWNAVRGRGSSLTGEAAQAHLALDARVVTLGGTDALGRDLNMAFHKLEMLNFLESGSAIPAFMRRAGSPQQLREWASSFVNDLAKGGF